MSYPASTLATDAAVLLGEPGMTRVTMDIWRIALNRVQRDLGVRINMFEQEYIFDITSDHRYTYPPGAVRVRFVRRGDDATEPDSFLFLTEMFEVEWRSSTTGHYPRGTPTRYFARRNWFHLWPWPDTAVASGGVLTAWSMPPDIVDMTSELTAFPDLMRDYVVDGMLVTGLRALRDYEAADEHYKGWLLRLPEIKGQVEDPSDDARPRFAPTGHGGPESQI